ncbi:hypothetical protein EJ08DRAFT_677385 [Tothia fuscella]|uniref:Uncharacterized protein n=1 Tax=Tothia fuscella TaxID=1048955 RepID=A0A9P4NWR6_9PEZI|nr:hypothetical protein EJ08DRAFT_677385 [Tothia fuscella]
MESAGISIAVAVFAEISNIMILVALFLLLTPYICQRTGQKPRVTRIINSCTIGLVGILLVPTLTLSGIGTLAVYSSSLSSSLSVPASRLSAAYYLIFFLSALIGSGILLLVMASTRQHPALNSVVITTLALLISSLVTIIQIFYYSITNHDSTDIAFIVIYALMQLFYVLSVFVILQASSHAATPLDDPTSNATYDPNAPEDERYRRFTYAGPTDETHLPPQYEPPGMYQYQEPHQQWNLHGSNTLPQTSEILGKPITEAQSHAY